MRKPEIVLYCILKQCPFFFLKFRDVGEPLYLTPYIESGDIATAKTLCEVTEPLDGIPTSEMPTESLSKIF